MYVCMYVSYGRDDLDRGELGAQYDRQLVSLGREICIRMVKCGARSISAYWSIERMVKRLVRGLRALVVTGVLACIVLSGIVPRVDHPMIQTIQNSVQTIIHPHIHRLNELKSLKNVFLWRIPPPATREVKHQESSVQSAIQSAIRAETGSTDEETCEEESISTMNSAHVYPILSTLVRATETPPCSCV